MTDISPSRTAHGRDGAFQLIGLLLPPATARLLRGKPVAQSVSSGRNAQA